MGETPLLFKEETNLMKTKLFYTVLLFLLLLGCQPKEINTSPETISFTDEDQALISFVHQKTDEKIGSKVEDFKVVKVSYIEQSGFGQFIFNKNEERFEGSFYAEHNKNNWEIVHLEIAKMDVNSPFTKLQVVGGLPNKDTNFQIICGVINDSRIKSVQITYPNNESSIIMIDNYKYYFDVRLGVKTFSTIVAYDENYNEISSY